MTNRSSTLWLEQAPLVLASGSPFRRALLESAEIPLDVVPASIDERAIEAAKAAEGAGPDMIARALSEAKAASVSGAHAGRLVLGCDQTLALGAEAFHKPADMVGAAAHLRKLSGRKHHLHAGSRWRGMVRSSGRMWNPPQ